MVTLYLSIHLVHLTEELLTSQIITTQHPIKHQKKRPKTLTLFTPYLFGWLFLFGHAFTGSMLFIQVSPRKESPTTKLQVEKKACIKSICKRSRNTDTCITAHIVKRGVFFWGLNDRKSSSKGNMKSRILGSLIGAAIGDPVGSHFEGQSPSHRQLKPSLFTCTDDTFLTSYFGLFFV